MYTRMVVCMCTGTLAKAQYNIITETVITTIMHDSLQSIQRMIKSMDNVSHGSSPLRFGLNTTLGLPAILKTC